MFRRIIITVVTLSLFSLGVVFAQYYDTKNLERIDETTFGGRIVKEAVFSYSWVANFGASQKSMADVLKNIKDTQDSRLLYNQFSYIAEKYTGQKTVKIFVKDVNSTNLFIDNQTTGTGATIASRCKLSGFSCSLVSSANFVDGKEYYIKMTSDVPFYINFCSDERESYIKGRGCVRTHEYCANSTGLQRILATDGFTVIPQASRVCGCSGGMHLSAVKNQCIADGAECSSDGGTYDESTGVCTRVIEVSTGQGYQCTKNVAQNGEGTQQLHKSFVYPNLISSVIDLDTNSNYLLAFISTGARSNGVLYEWKGTGCAVQDSSDKQYGQLKCGSSSSGTYVNTTKPKIGDTVYFSLRAACGTKTTTNESFGLTEKKAKLTLKYYESTASSQ